MVPLNQIAFLNILEALEIAEELDGYERSLNIRQNPFELPESKFIKIFRLNKSMVEDIINEIDPFITHSRISWGIETQDKLFAALRFFGSGAYQNDIACNKYCAMSQSRVSKSIHEVLDAFEESGIFHRWIHFPKNFARLNEYRANFFNKYRFPGVVGCIDCTHVAIFPPSVHDPNYPEHIYVNRRGYHSINVQLVCDAEKKIINVNARFPGSTGDSYIWNNSTVSIVMEQLYRQHPNSYYLLGDSGYPLRPWLLTPLEEVTATVGERNYEKCQKTTRTIIEHVNGILKMRFRCLLKYRTLHYQPIIASKIINACCVLHNMCIDEGLPHVPKEMDDDDPLEGLNINNNVVLEPQTMGRVNPDLAAGRALQKNLINQYFCRGRF